ncbi:protein-disulfide reductase DsbD family protein [Zavarzinia sp. CC-PAN008]|uniref:protein-disulfide reductase DsbD family protein n=1 Tax=Zavarzinia sp. CC-PAN008 TaxID=3243332 RepID=UPI003F746C1E
MRNVLTILALIVLLAVGGQVPASANVVKTEHVEAELVARDMALVPGQTQWLGLRFKLIPGWHTYWSNPGDAGEPPRLTWTLPPGFTADEIAWPNPKRIPYGPLMSYGYEHEVTMPVALTVPADAAPASTVSLGLEATWLVCAEICVPEEGRFTLDLPVAAAAGGTNAAHWIGFEKALAAQARPLPGSARASLADGTLVLDVAVPELATAQAAGRISDIWFFPESYGILEHAAPQRFAASGQDLRLEVQAGTMLATRAEPVRGLLVVTQDTADGPRTDGFAVAAAYAAPRPDAAAGASTTPPAPVQGGSAGLTQTTTPAADGIGLGQALLWALLGGLILNLMPCVFPILWMKALGFVEQAHRPAHLRVHGLVFTAGVLVTFAALAGLLIAVKAAGAAVGWGFQLQSPLVVTLLAYLMFALGLNLTGVFELGGRLQGVGQGLAERSGHAGAFFTGALAVVVATPCTAPFMGAAIGFAMTQGWAVALAVFLALGLGLALPYLLLSLMPGLARRLPRPGPWMTTLRQLLAFPMYATAIWLVWVLAQQAGPDAVAVVLVGALLIALGLWLWGRVAASGGWGLVGRGVGIAALAGAIALAVLGGSTLGPAPASAALPGASGSGPVHEAYSADRLGALQAQGTPVFVNMTAAWCITCLVNERVALSGEAVRDDFARAGITYLKGDWTRQDPQITAFLERFGRSGVPLYVLFPKPGSGRQPEVLPQILTPDIVAEAVARLN